MNDRGRPCHQSVAADVADMPPTVQSLENNEVSEISSSSLATHLRNQFLAITCVEIPLHGDRFGFPWLLAKPNLLLNCVSFSSFPVLFVHFLRYFSTRRMQIVLTACFSFRGFTWFTYYLHHSMTQLAIQLQNHSGAAFLRITVTMWSQIISSFECVSKAIFAVCSPWLGVLFFFRAYWIKYLHISFSQPSIQL